MAGGYLKGCIKIFLVLTAGTYFYMSRILYFRWVKVGDILYGTILLFACIGPVFIKEIKSGK
jgi:hypothetical protein